MVQSLSGTGSLRVGAEFISKFLPGITVYLSNPTWGNHRNIFADAGVEWKYYRWAQVVPEWGSSCRLGGEACFGSAGNWLLVHQPVAAAGGGSLCIMQRPHRLELVLRAGRRVLGLLPLKC